MKSLGDRLYEATAISRCPTFSDRLTATRNRPSGFDYLRIVLASSVILWHSRMISYGIDAPGGLWERVLEPLALLIVPMFFALSGFLVAGSLERSRSLFNFLGLRVFRIMPALSVEVLISAFIFGPLLTKYSLPDYFTDHEFHLYLLNILGDIHYKLPGVFQDNPSTLVNGQLWTVPYELVCYLLLSILAISGIVRRRRLLLGFLVIYYAAQLANTLLRPSTGFQGAGGSTIVMSFVAGLVLFCYRDQITWSKLLFLAMLAVSIALPMFIPKGMRFAAIPIAYVTVYLGLTSPPRNWLILSGDYSYGLFLYGFPVQQAVSALGPYFREWYINLLIAVPVTIIIAATSWWLIEKPILNHRGKLITLEDWYIHRFLVKQAS